MKIRYIAIIMSLLFLWSCNQDAKSYVTIKTEFGDIKVELYDSTPKHKENFIKLVEEGFYEDLLFHRVMEGFMVQGGDPQSKDAAPGVKLGMGGPGYTLPAEIGAPHFKGTLAAARKPDAMNPKKKSSGSQFYLVQGKVRSDQELDFYENKGGFKYNPEQRAKYKTIGGAPMLDNEYTVFGEVVEGIDIIDKIAAVEVDENNRPFKDIKMDIVK